jgi:ribosomal protein L37E
LYCSIDLLKKDMEPSVNDMGKKEHPFTVKKCRRCGSVWTQEPACPSCGNTDPKGRTTDKNEYNKKAYREGKPHRRQPPK